MLDRRLVLIGSAAPVGLLAGALVWIATGSDAGGAKPIDALQAQIGSAPSALHPQPGPSGIAASNVTAKPVFLMSVGPGAVSLPSVRLVGVALTPRSRAALLAIDTAPPEWVTVGDVRRGLVISAITKSTVELDTQLGPRTVSFTEPLGEPTQAGATSAATSHGAAASPPTAGPAPHP